MQHGNSGGGEVLVVIVVCLWSETVKMESEESLATDRSPSHSISLDVGDVVSGHTPSSSLLSSPHRIFFFQFPDFTLDSQLGPISYHALIEGKWGLIVTFHKSFDPVATTV